MNKFRLGDLVTPAAPLDDNNFSGLIVKGPYPALFTIEDGVTVFSEECLAVDLVCDGKLYEKVKCSSLRKVST